MQLRSISIILFFLFFLQTHAQEKKKLNITRTENAPKIDGILDDDIWATAEIATDFVQFTPEMGVKFPESQRTEVRMTYDDDAIYLAAYLYDDPKDIMKQLTARDNFGQTDFFNLVLNPNNDAQNDTQFIVFSSGVQADAIASPSIGEDYSWNAVWDSAVKINDDGWSLEMKIPYRTLRFANQDVPTWGIQFFRQFRRFRSQSSWNPIDITKGNVGLYHGELKGLDGIEPPTRLILYPFATGIVNSFDGETEAKATFGMDVKYGITENFTLDATLVPDFSQAGFDNVVLNLGPFEQTFSEQRQFFTEGVDLFSKGGLFFSRRIGSGPSGDVTLNDNETIDSPNEVKVLNALKISGRTKEGLGIGVFNAITETTNARITNEDTGESREAIIEPFTNYNILVIDKQFRGNSSISLINTNVLREGSFRDANVTAARADIINKKNTFRFIAEGKLSYVNYQNTDAEFGKSTFFFAGKVAGNFRYSFDHRFADTKYEINDLGLQFRNNFNNFGIDASYQIFEPKGKLNNYRINGFANYRRLANPGVFTGFNFGGGYRATTTKLDAFGFRLNLEPGKQNDYFESRDGRRFIYENFISTGGWVSSNYNRVFAIDVRANMGTLFEDGRDLFTYDFNISPRVRFSDHFLMVYRISFNHRNGDRGYATEVDDEPIFGERNRQIVTNTISANYTFDPFNVLALSFRHYWDTVDYDYDMFTLQDNGRLTTNSGFNRDNIGDDPNINFSTWNIDLSYSWQFAPGSFLTALYRNSLFNFDNLSQESYGQSLNQLFDQPIQNTFSLRLQYFIDYNDAKQLLQSKNKSNS
jgi:hypothetical protein